MRPRTTLAAAPAAALLALATCAEPPTPTAAGGPETTDLGELMADGHDDHPCTFVWEELPFEDDSIIPHHIERYDAEVYAIPYNVLSNDSSRQPADFLLPPLEPWYLDVEDDVIRWRCPGDESLTPRVSVRPLGELPAWAKYSNDSSRFEIRDWPDYPYEGDPVVAYETPEGAEEHFDTAVLRLELFARDPEEVVGEADFYVDFVVGPPAPIGFFLVYGKPARSCGGAIHLNCSTRAYTEDWSTK